MSTRRSSSLRWSLTSEILGAMSCHHRQAREVVQWPPRGSLSPTSGELLGSRKDRHVRTREKQPSFIDAKGSKPPLTEKGLRWGEERGISFWRIYPQGLPPSSANGSLCVMMVTINVQVVLEALERANRLQESLSRGAAQDPYADNVNTQGAVLTILRPRLRLHKYPGHPGTIFLPHISTHRRHSASILPQVERFSTPHLHLCRLSSLI